MAQTCRILRRERNKGRPWHGPCRVCRSEAGEKTIKAYRVRVSVLVQKVVEEVVGRMSVDLQFEVHNWYGFFMLIYLKTQVHYK